MTNTFALTEEQLQRFNADGFLIAKGLLDSEEIGLLHQVAREDRVMQQNGFGVADVRGRLSRLAVWNHPGDDIYGMVSRSTRIVDAMEQLLGGEVYHYHSKVMLKEPFVGGAWEWHQDYGYWYQNGCLLPDMASCTIAIDRATRENGCLQVLRGSHRMGRIEHGVQGKQTGADLERVDAAKQRFSLVYLEADPGDAIFFHSNLLHASGPNESANSRWSFICCYNAAHNNPYKDSEHPRYTPLDKVDADAIKRVGRLQLSTQRTFLSGPATPPVPIAGTR